MTIRHEIKSQLAKLLATEDLVVEHKKVETAQFNVQTRVLTLPMWEKASDNVLDALVCHEVGHALYTPDIDWSKDRKIGFDFVNIVEDARIEKLMKRRYAGIPKTFYNGYLELHDNDFFEVEGRDISVVDISNDFVQIDLISKSKKIRITMAIRGKLAELLVDIDPKSYGPHCITKDKKCNEVIYISLFRHYMA